MNAETPLIPAHQELVAVWEEHMKCEFETRSAADTMRTRIEGAYVNHVPVLTGGVGLDDVKTFYDRHLSHGCRPIRIWRWSQGRSVTIRSSMS